MSDASSPSRPRREARGKQAGSYRLDKYSYLDSTSAQASTHAANQDESDADDFMPDAQEEPEDDLEMVDEPDDPESEDNDLHQDDESDAMPARAMAKKNTSSTRKPPIVTAKAAPPATPSKPPIDRRASILSVDDIKASPGTIQKKIRKKPGDDAVKLHSRGVADFTKSAGQENKWKVLYGPKREDLVEFLATRDHWTTQETIPVRKLLRRSFFEREGAREKESKNLLSWYLELGRQAFAKGQVVRELNQEDSRPYLNNAGPPSLNVLMGPIQQPQVFSLTKGSHMNVATPFPEEHSRHGFLLNLGSRVQDAQWASAEDDSTQYIAVAVEQISSGKQPEPLENPKASAFSPTLPFEASIQIWSFKATDEGLLNTSVEPRLALVICSDWGAPKHIRWCPFKAKDSQYAFSESIHLGLLAGIWSDGHVRVLDVPAPKSSDHLEGPLYLHFSSAAFDVAIPNTMPSCLHWLSAMSLAVGTAAGAVAIWTLNRRETFAHEASTPHSPKPWFYQKLADTYILTVSSGWPSRPEFLSITSADGFAKLVDLRSPKTDNVLGIRGRTLTMSQGWHEQTQSFVMHDEHYMIKHNHIRRYYNNMYTMRSESSITRVTTSPVHPGMMFGAAGGNVECTNPVARIANHKVIPWQQRWFVHEWRPAVADMAPDAVKSIHEDADKDSKSTKKASEEVAQDNASTDQLNAADNGVPAQVLSEPLVRITEGYKVTQPGVATASGPAIPDFGRGLTIYEEKSGITALAWNPNLKYGTWAVAGMGSGLLRVEDLGV